MPEVAINSEIQEVLNKLGIQPKNKGAAIGNQFLETTGETITSYSPVDGNAIANITFGDEASYQEIMKQAQSAFKEWRKFTAPKRGDVVRQVGDALRANKKTLGTLVSYEMGKSLQEGYGEVQEMIDICDFAVGQSRQLYGFTMHSERPNHRMYDQYHPVGVVGIISAFNFPVAVWSWNAMLAWICGDVCIWKPSEKSSLCAIACQNIINKVFEKNDVPNGVSNLIIGDYKIGELMSNDTNLPLVTATGSTRMGKKVGKAVGARLGKSILELGGNNAIIITESADLKTVIPATVFGAVGTAGQRCTSTRRLIIHSSIYDKVKDNLVSAYQQLRIGNPLDENNHVGPLIDTDAVNTYLNALEEIKKEGGSLLVEGGKIEGLGSNCYVQVGS